MTPTHQPDSIPGGRASPLEGTLGRRFFYSRVSWLPEHT
ncbi:hypothetical protein FRUB_08180 [Fimbriiglobus ruber]|uniref:Uncharacterized protein n=1 Tax=Fimbriiglobus ruber TaxID=1908690 RepID=A0A225DHN7_9BACT|nr:hypothetical protein FRUB_08180 [Fimbriiglobus ruber]